MDTLAAYCVRPVSADVIPLRAGVKGNEKRHPSLSPSQRRLITSL
jgi:hypothetical protein